MRTVDHRVSRRTVTRGAAWSAPVIVLATAAPVMAASGPVTVTTLPPTATRGQLDSVFTTIRFLNSSAEPTPATVAVTLTPTPDVGGTVTDERPRNISTGWSPLTGTPTGTETARTFTFVGTVLGASAPDQPRETVLTFAARVVPVGGVVSTGTITVDPVVTAPGARAEGAEGSWV